LGLHNIVTMERARPAAKRRSPRSDVGACDAALVGHGDLTPQTWWGRSWVTRAVSSVTIDTQPGSVLAHMQERTLATSALSAVPRSPIRRGCDVPVDQSQTISSLPGIWRIKWVSAVLPRPRQRFLAVSMASRLNRGNDSTDSCDHSESTAAISAAVRTTCGSAPFAVKSGSYSSCACQKRGGLDSACPAQDRR
jgi:hypothetical protein